MHKNSLFTMNDLSVEEIYKVLEDGQRFADEPGLEFPKAHLVANLFLNRARERITPLLRHNSSWDVG